MESEVASSRCAKLPFFLPRKLVAPSRTKLPSLVDGSLAFVRLGILAAPAKGAMPIAGRHSFRLRSILTPGLQRGREFHQRFSGWPPGERRCCRRDNVPRDEPLQVNHHLQRGHQRLHILVVLLFGLERLLLRLLHAQVALIHLRESPPPSAPSPLITCSTCNPGRSGKRGVCSMRVSLERGSEYSCAAGAYLIKGCKPFTEPA